MRRVLTASAAAFYSLTTIALLAAIGTFVSGDNSIARDAGHAPGFALIMILND